MFRQSRQGVTHSCGLRVSPAVAEPDTGLQTTSRPLSHQQHAPSAAVILLCHIPAPAAAVPDKNKVQVLSSNIWDLNYRSYNKRTQPGISVLLQAVWADVWVEKITCWWDQPVQSRQVRRALVIKIEGKMRQFLCLSNNWVNLLKVFAPCTFLDLVITVLWE